MLVRVEPSAAAPSPDEGTGAHRLASPNGLVLEWQGAADLRLIGQWLRLGAAGHHAPDGGPAAGVLARSVHCPRNSRAVPASAAAAVESWWLIRTLGDAPKLRVRPAPRPASTVEPTRLRSVLAVRPGLTTLRHQKDLCLYLTDQRGKAPLAKLLNTSATNYYLEELIKAARERLIIISDDVRLSAETIAKGEDGAQAPSAAAVRVGEKVRGVIVLPRSCGLIRMQAYAQRLYRRARFHRRVDWRWNRAAHGGGPALGPRAPRRGLCPLLGRQCLAPG